MDGCAAARETGGVITGIGLAGGRAVVTVMSVRVKDRNHPTNEQLMKRVHRTAPWIMAGAILAGWTALAGVTFVGNDWDTDAAWRTPEVAKPNDLDGDNIYGTAGYYLPAGLRAGYEDPWLADNVITGPSNDDDINTLPDFITGLEFADAAQRGRSWGGAGGNFGALDNVGGGHTGWTGAPILLSPGSSDPMTLVLKRTDSPAFRLTLILGNNPDEGPFSDPQGQEITVDDGTGPVTQISGDTVFHARTTYQSWDIPAGSSDITITLVGLPAGTGVARLSGLAIDTLEVLPPKIVSQPVGGTFVAGNPLTLRVEASGAQLSYQWYKDGVEIPGATEAALTIDALTEADAGDYHVVVSNAGGSVTSDAVTITVEAGLPPALVAYQQAVQSHPALLAYYTFDAANASDATGVFPGTLVGTTAFGAGVGGGADKALVRQGGGHVTLGEVPEFDFSTGVGTVEGWIRADWAPGGGYNPAIWADRDGGPVNWSIHMRRGDKASIMHWNGSAVAQIAIPPAGEEWHHLAMTFNGDQWSVYWDGELMGTATQPFGAGWESPTQLGSSSAAATTEGWMGALDEVAFYADILDENTIREHYNHILAARPPEIVAQPQGGTFLAGLNVTLQVEVKGLNLAYQWYKDGEPIAGATGATLNLPAIGAADAGEYRVEVSNPNGTVSSDPVTVAVEEAIPANLAGYQQALAGETSLLAYYAFDDLTARDTSGHGHDGTLVGSAAFGEGVAGGADKAVVLDGNGHVDLGQVPPLDFADGTGTVELFVRADWEAAPSYNPVVVSDRDREMGLINYSFNLSADKTQLIFFDGVNAQTATLLAPAGEVWHHLAVVFNGANSAFYWDGQFAGNFDATVFGGSPEAPTQLGSAAPIGQLRWMGALDEVAFLDDPLPAAAIQQHYAAFLGESLPVIVAQPVGGNRFVGQGWTFAVAVQGANLAFQWYKDGQPIAGATGAKLELADLTAADAGVYHVVVSNAAGAVSSDPAALAVIVPDLAAYQQAVKSEPGLISYYSFDLGDALDDVGPYPGYLDGDALPVDGLAGGPDMAIQITETGFVGLGQVDAFDFADGVGTVEGWIRADWAPGGGYNPAIWADRDGGPVNWSIHMRRSDKAAIMHWNGSQVATVPIPPAGDGWHHLVCVFEGDQWTVYWDGELAGTRTQAFGTAGPDVPTQLGSSSSTGTEQWLGAIDEVAFYSTALSAEAVRRHYYAMVGEPAAPPRLEFSVQGSQLTLQWDPALTGFVLEYADELPAAQWTPVPGVTGNQVTVEMDQVARFYRLRKP
ncbi:MAG: hypothetical protein D6766_06660 [Verrucomicrobia bacterium]|nr:MAG: hypothetical protein D6766_06660 [Verrucomicrobiota bacterium]